MKKLRLLGALCAVLLSAIPLGTVHAIPIHLEFIVSDFGLGTNGSAAPQGIVSGSIFYEASSTTSTIDFFTDIDLTILTHSFDAGEVSFTTQGVVTSCIGDIFNDICNVGGREYDFRIRWNQNTLIPQDFAYSTGSIETWATTKFDSFSITAVPIPPALLLFGSGLVGLIGIARRKKAA